MTDYNAQMAKLSDDMVGQLFLAAQRALIERGLNVGDIVRRQIRRGEVVCWRGTKDGELHYGIVEAINQVTIKVKEGNKHNPEVPTGTTWKLSPELTIPLGPLKDTGLAKKELERPAHQIQTQSQEAW